ncbi:MAG: YbgA family protein [Arenicellales bacterium]
MSQLPDKPQIGASACLNVQKVRFDGGHKNSAFVNNECTDYFDLHTVCPEVGIGLSTPRPVIQLRDFEGVTKLVFSKTPEKELTEVMNEYAEKKIDTLPQLDGFIFKKDSPSCGPFRVPVVNNKTGMRKRDGTGLFAQKFKQRHPNVPIEDEGRINDAGIRENFLERVYAHYRWRQVTHSMNPLKEFRQYHKNYKLMLMAKDNKAYRQLGRLAASVNKHNFNEVSEEYFSKFMQAMAKIPTHGQHINVMMHVLGYLKSHLEKDDKAEVLDWFESYRDERVSRITPMMLLKHHFRHHPNSYIHDQYYFSTYQ